MKRGDKRGIIQTEERPPRYQDAPADKMICGASENANKKETRRKHLWNQDKTGRGCPSLVGGRPAKSVAGNGRVGSNPTPRANKNPLQDLRFEEIFALS
jgi:hypothetical protein